MVTGIPQCIILGFPYSVSDSISAFVLSNCVSKLHCGNVVNILDCSQVAAYKYKLALMCQFSLCFASSRLQMIDKP